MNLTCCEEFFWTASVNIAQAVENSELRWIYRSCTQGASSLPAHVLGDNNYIYFAKSGGFSILSMNHLRSCVFPRSTDMKWEVIFLRSKWTTECFSIFHLIDTWWTILHVHSKESFPCTYIQCMHKHMQSRNRNAKMLTLWQINRAVHSTCRTRDVQKLTFESVISSPVSPVTSRSFDISLIFTFNLGDFHLGG